MIKILGTKKAPSERLGRTLWDLARLEANSFVIAPTLILPHGSFELFAKDGRLGNQYLNQLMSGLQEKSFEQASHLFVGISVSRHYNGLFKCGMIPKELTRVQFTIEKIYRSWYDEPARASRITTGVEDEESIPIVYVQPFYEGVFSLVTRAPASGEGTNGANYALNIHNTISSFKPKYVQFLRRVEETLRSPAKIYLLANARDTICGVTDQVMTDAAYWQVLDELLENEIIDPIDYVMRVRPGMVSYCPGIRYTADGPDTEIADGLSASPGVTRGKLIFRSTEPRLLTTGESYILGILGDFSPEDVRLLEACSGAFQIMGHLTGHLAKICRGWGKPAVVDIRNLMIDESSGTMVCGGKVVNELSPVVVDGTSGRVVVGERVVASQIHEMNATPSHLDRLTSLVESLSDRDLFRNLPLEVQKQIATLKLRLRHRGRYA